MLKMTHVFTHQALSRSDDVIEETKSPIGWGRFYTSPIGPLPSVTTVLSMQDHSWLDEWKERVGEEEAKRVTAEAARRGTLVHSALEDFLNNKELFLDWLTKSHFIQVKKELISLIEKVHALETPLYSSVLRVAGRCDCIATINGELHIVDFKTSRNEKSWEDIDGYKMQCSAYAVMANEVYDLKIKKFCIVISNLQENYPSIYFGEAKNHIGDFAKLRRKFGDV